MTANIREGVSFTLFCPSTKSRQFCFVFVFVVVVVGNDVVVVDFVLSLRYEMRDVKLVILKNLEEILSIDARWCTKDCKKH